MGKSHRSKQRLKLNDSFCQLGIDRFVWYSLMMYFRPVMGQKDPSRDVIRLVLRWKIRQPSLALSSSTARRDYSGKFGHTCSLSCPTGQLIPGKHTRAKQKWRNEGKQVRLLA